MNINTGEIRSFPTQADAKRAGFDIPLSPADLLKLEGKTPAERIEWAKVNKARHFKPRKSRSR